MDGEPAGPGRESIRRMDEGGGIGLGAPGPIVFPFRSARCAIAKAVPTFG